tara:strand:+ start:1642 stop:1953 length:312 start_codon:yes stop_codon:yes gene_type:complete
MNLSWMENKIFRRSSPSRWGAAVFIQAWLYWRTRLALFTYICPVRIEKFLEAQGEVERGGWSRCEWPQNGRGAEVEGADGIKGQEASEKATGRYRSGVTQGRA